MSDSRRNFFRTIGRSVAGASAPLILGASKKSGSANPILGEGDHKYECIHDWGELPANIKYGNTHGVCEDSQGHIYVHHTVNAASESSRHHGGLRRQGEVRQVAGARSSRAARTACTSARKAAPNILSVRHQARPGGEDHAEWRRGLQHRLSRRIGSLQARRRRQEAQVQPDQPGDRAQRRYLRRRRLRVQLHQPVQQARASTSAPSAARAKKPASWIARTASPWTRAARSRS